MKTLSYTQTPLQTKVFTHRRLYTQKPLHTDAFTHRRSYTKMLLHTEPCTQSLSHTHTHFQHRDRVATDASRSDFFVHFFACADRHFVLKRCNRRFGIGFRLSSCTQGSLGTDTFNGRNFRIHTNVLYSSHKAVFTQNPLQTLLHTNVLKHSFLQTKAFALSSLEIAQRVFDTEKPLHRAVFTHNQFLHTEVCTQMGRCTQKFLPTESFSQSSL